ncbi:alpha/beta fold hydrolase [Arthrobacter globiformis]|uniref:alpha/beta fold hydrolase n=1 Tax=Arthrobacter globiformis TaxID=1665 RepID=UPI0027904B5D|nr:alpha/beta hydrolase [Arthrobacter globiformis]MDQ0618434.1 pimeloyl-ACP methyl ester carboxylesterase [Arthrobacter globiformis]
MHPTYVLTHGLWSDGSCWSDVITSLARSGRSAIAAQLPLENFTGDVDALRRTITSIPGPVVVAGWSYGGAVMSQAVTGLPNVQSLVYVAAFAPAVGESVQDISGRRAGGALGQAVRVVGDTHLIIDPDQYGAVMAEGADPDRITVAAAVQKHVRMGLDASPLEQAAWPDLPTHFLVAERDEALPAETQRELAARMNATVQSIDGPHALMLTHPEEVAAALLAAA